MHLPRAAPLVLLGAVSGCDLLIAADDYAVGTPHGCRDNETLVDGGCVRIGPSCIGPALETDDERICVPVAASSYCDDGEMALVGTTSCERIARDPCPELDDPVDFESRYAGGSLFVWQQAAPGGDGTAAAPFQRIADALAAAAEGGQVVLAPGSYDETVTLTQPVALRGVCPERVSLAAGLVVEASAAGSSVSELSVTSTTEAVLVRGADDITLEQLRVVHSGRAGIVAERTRSPSSTRRSLHIERVLVDGATGTGIRSSGYQLMLRDVHIRDIAEQPARFALGRGIWVTPGRFVDERGASDHGALDMSRSLVEGCHDAGVLLEGVDGTFDGVIIRDIRGSAVSPELGLGARGHGISIAAELARGIEVPSPVVIRNSLIDGAHDAAVRISGAKAVVRESVLRRTLSGSGSCAGHGLRVVDQGAVEVSSTLIEANEQTGVQIVGAAATLSDSIVRLTSSGFCRVDRSDPSSADFGDGVGAYAAPRGSDEPPMFAHVKLIRSRIDANSRHGALVYGDATLDLSQSLLHDNGGGVDHLLRARYHPADSTAAGDPAISFSDSRQCAHVDRRLFDCQRLADELTLLAPALYARDDSGSRLPATAIALPTTEPTSLWPLGRDELARGATGSNGEVLLRQIPTDARLTFAARASGQIGALSSMIVSSEPTADVLPWAHFAVTEVATAFAALTGRALDFDDGMVLIAAFDAAGMPSSQPITVTADGGTIAYFDGERLQSQPTRSGRALIAELPPGSLGVEISSAAKSCGPAVELALLRRRPSLLRVRCGEP